jgi:hypothetical protein
MNHFPLPKTTSQTHCSLSLSLSSLLDLLPIAGSGNVFVRDARYFGSHLPDYPVTDHSFFLHTFPAPFFNNNAQVSNTRASDCAYRAGPSNQPGAPLIENLGSRFARDSILDHFPHLIKMWRKSGLLASVQASLKHVIQPSQPVCPLCLSVTR